MRAELLTAARLDACCAGAHHTTLLGRALMPDGFETLQHPPVSLPPYAAARVRHALAKAPNVLDAEVLEVAKDYVTCAECTLPASMERLVKMCMRAGAPSPRGAALGLVWARNMDEALPLAVPHPPYPFLREAMRAEVRRVRRECFS
jgi:hypothetical protein